MTEHVDIVEAVLEHGDDKFLLKGYLLVDEVEPSFVVHFEMIEAASDRDEKFMTLDMNYSVENPLIEGGIVVTAVSAYASCLAYAGFKFGVKAVRRCYRQSNVQNPGADARQRIKDIADCLSNQGGGAKDAISDALSDCIPLKKLFSGGDDDDGSIDD